ncbi:MAG: DUF5684 domain-containing protein [Bacilli bacterium]|nr:DUF5684 domain-containing protein [Bacilli bacterium]
MLNNYANMSNETSTFLMSLIIAVAIVGFVIYLILGISWSKIFKSNGEKGFKAFIPVYNACVLMEIVGMNPAMVLLFLIPIVNLFVLALVSVRVANKFEKGAGFAIGLLFFPFICYPILAFSSSEVKEKREVKKHKKEALAEEEDPIICSVCGTTLAPDATECFVCGEKVEPKNAETVEVPVLEQLAKEEMSKNSLEEMPTLETEEKEETPSLENIEEPALDPIYGAPQMEEKQEEPVYSNIEEEEIPVTPIPSSFVEEEVPAAPTNDFDINEIVNAYNTDEAPLEPVSPEVEEAPYESREPYKYKASSKTLDEILKLNNNLYTNIENKKKEEDDLPKEENLISKEDVQPLVQTELPKEKEAELEQEVDDFVKELLHLKSENEATKEDVVPVEPITTNFVKEEIPSTQFDFMPAEPFASEETSAPSVEKNNDLFGKANEMNIPVEEKEIEPYIPEEVSIPKVEEKDDLFQKINEMNAALEEQEPEPYMQEESSTPKAEEKDDLFEKINEMNAALEKQEESYVPEEVNVPKIEGAHLFGQQSTVEVPLEETSIPAFVPNEPIDLTAHFPKVEKLPVDEAPYIKEEPVVEEVKHEEFVKPGIGQVRTCTNCGSTIPRYSQRCLLCGQAIEK